MRDLVTALCANAGFHPFVTLSLISAFVNAQWDLSTTQIIPGNGSRPVRWLGLGTIDFTSVKDTGGLLFHPIYGFSNLESRTVTDHTLTWLLQGQRDVSRQSLPQGHRLKQKSVVTVAIGVKYTILLF